MATSTKSTPQHQPFHQRIRRWKLGDRNPRVWSLLKAKYSCQIVLMDSGSWWQMRNHLELTFHGVESPAASESLAVSLTSAIERRFPGSRYPICWLQTEHGSTPAKREQQYDTLRKDSPDCPQTKHPPPRSKQKEQLAHGKRKFVDNKIVSNMKKKNSPPPPPRPLLEQRRAMGSPRSNRHVHHHHQGPRSTIKTAR
ncbi:hypothetical protein BDZ45DRAFT_744560 [Acephala macrosclerotiorum]|nr:hypothetical protein BDZ45DRAFT_744560 [Acephala macrosclerotiorum]